MSKKGRIENRDGKLRVRFGRKIQKRFTDEARADRYLTALRYQDDEGIIDPRDHAKGAPLSIRAQAEKWLGLKGNVSRRYKRNLERWLELLAEFVKNKNAKHIGLGDIEDFMATQAGYSEKTRADMLRCYDQFFRWFSKREKLYPLELPLIKNPKLGWREITDLDTQSAILEEVRKIAPFKVWLGIKWLATYIAIRPCEMRALRERDVNVNGMLVCRPQTTKERKPKLVPMLDEDIEIFQSIGKSFPDMPFFRWEDGEPMGDKVFPRWWVKARNNLKISKVGLYGGTRSTGATAMAAVFSRDQIKNSGTMHGTDRAFDRYCQREAAPSREIYQTLANARKVVKIEEAKEGDGK